MSYPNIRFVAGVDEAGRGCLAGPVVAAAVVFAPGQKRNIYGDSKTFTSSQREVLYKHLSQEAMAIGVGVVHSNRIDKINILQASLLAMKIAVEKLGLPLELILVDGNQIIKNLDIAQKTIVKGDSKVPLIGAASIVAKVIRDRIMLGYDRVYPEYGFAKHKGYGTKQHYLALEVVGQCPIHRQSFNLGQQLSLF